MDGCTNLRPHAWAAADLVELRHVGKKRRDKKVQHSQWEEPNALPRHGDAGSSLFGLAKWHTSAVNHHIRSAIRQCCRESDDRDYRDEKAQLV